MLQIQTYRKKDIFVAKIIKCSGCDKLLAIELDNGRLLIGDNVFIDVALYCGDCGEYFEWTKRYEDKFRSITYKDGIA